MPRSEKKGSARLGQVRGHVGRGHPVLDLGVRDGAVFLAKVQPQLTLVAEVQVAFLTLRKENGAGLIHSALSAVDSAEPRVDLHGRASLPCGCAGGSSASAGGGSASRRSRTDKASPPCGSARGRGDERPARRMRKC